MRFPKIEIDEKVLAALAKKYNIREIRLFGSALREDFHDDSDLDLLVEFTRGTDYSLFDLFTIKDDFSKQLGYPVDLIEKAGLRNPFRKKMILGTAKIVYAA